MFRKFVDSLEDESPGQFERIRYYLTRHVEVDEGSHGPMSLKTICELCGNEAKRWQEATDATSAALRARIQLWDAIVAVMEEQARVAFETGRGLMMATNSPKTTLTQP